MAIPSIQNNSPQAGHFAWGAFNIQLNGVTYQIPAASSNQRWVWWEFNNGSPVIRAGADVPATLVDDDLVLFANKNGIGVRVQSSNFVDGELLVDGSIFADALSVNLISSQHIVTAGLDAGVIKFGSMHGDRIQVGTLDANRIVVKGTTSAEDKALINYTEDRAKKAYDDAVTYLTSKGTDLVTNGTGFLKTNYNFSFTNVKTDDAPVGAVASFESTGAQGAYWIDELIPFDPTKSYKISYQVRQKVAGATNRAYGMITPYDAQGNMITYSHTSYYTGSTTTLAAPLNPGDTTITLTDATNWRNAEGANVQNRTMMIWNWVDPNGKMWGPETYTRNYIKNDTWADGGISGNVITLKTPWAGPALAAGHPVSNGSAPGSFVYVPFFSNAIVPEAWTSYSGVFSGGVRKTSAAVGSPTHFGWTAGMPPGCANIKLGWLLNYPASPANAVTATGKHALAAVSFSDASAASQAAFDAYTRWAPTGQTTIDGGKITADSIAAAQIAANAISASELAANAVTTVKLNALAITAEKIAVNAVIAEKIMANAVTAVKIAANAVEADKILANAVTSDKIIANAITAVKIATDAVEADKIKANAITAGKIAVEAVEADKIAANAITAVKIAANAVEADKIMANAITAIKIMAGAIETDKIAANAITAAKIKAGEITTDHIITTGIDAKVITFGTMNGERIDVGTLNANRINSTTITSDFLKSNDAFITALQTVDLSATTFTGATIRTAATGTRVVIENFGSIGQIEFFGATDTPDPALIKGIIDESRQTLALYSGRQTTAAADRMSTIFLKGGVDATQRKIALNTDLVQANAHVFANTLELSGGTMQAWDIISKQRGILVQQGGLKVEAGGVVFDTTVKFQRSPSSSVFGITSGEEIARTTNAQGFYRINHKQTQKPQIVCQSLNEFWVPTITDRDDTYANVTWRRASDNQIAPAGTTCNMVWIAIASS